jgi:putative tricarboxylic transport membrane protein
MTKNVIGSIFFLAFSSFYFFNVFSIKEMPGAEWEVMTPSTFPFYLGITGIVVSLLLLVLSLLNKDKDLYFVIVMIFYGYTIRTLGFIIATILFLAAGFIILQERNIKRVLLISVGVSVGFYLLLNNVLGVYIDPGMVVEYFMGVE